MIVKQNMSINIENLTAKELRESFIKTKELAYKWDLTVLTLKRWRWEGTGSRFSKKGRGVFYNIEEIQKYENSEILKEIRDLKWKKSKTIEDRAPEYITKD